MGANDIQHGGSHYAKGGDYQHWDLIADSYGMGYHIGCATKYLCRWKNKNGIEDLNKAAHFTQKAMELYYRGVPWPNEDRPTSEQLWDFFEANEIGDEERKITLLLMRGNNIKDWDTALEGIADLIAEEANNGTVL